MISKIIKNKVFIGAVLLVVGIAIGRYAAPSKVITRTKIKTVEVIKEVKVKDDTKSKQNNTQTHIIVTEFPDGRKITETFILDKDTIFVTSKESSSTESSKESEISKEKIIENQKAQWSFGIMANSEANLLKGPNYGIMVSRRILGPFSLGVQGDVTGDSKRYGAFIRMEF